ncbi:MAG: HEPN domain-containing protein [Bacillota bacterium]
MEMPERSGDWMKQAEADLRHARNSVSLQDYEWACFSAQQAAEKAVKAVFQQFHAEAWGHSVSILLMNLPAETNVSPELVDKAKVIDKHYIPARYPNGFDTGAPTDYFTAAEGKTAVEIASEIIEFCKNILAK